MTQQSVKTWIIAAFIAILAFAGISAGAEESGHVAIGVLATMDREQCLEEWSETAAFLHQKIPGINFRILPLVYDEIQTAVRDEKVDFILANPLFYVELESRYGVNRIATLKNRCLGGACKTYGGVVFWLKKRKDISGIADLKGKRFMAANEHSLGGWLIIWRELKEQGLDPYRDFTSLTFGRAHDNVVQAVLEGRTDAGGVRTDILEYMAAEGKIRLEDFRILPDPAGNQKTRPYLCSTREYPEWPMAKL
ncbi:MAG: phosphate/phosphite/phosphonate ABC transporter substrate-binding protein, partial [Deltaproteobacteria bacterium]